MVQAEPYYLKAAFDELRDKTVLCPVLHFGKGYERAQDSFVKIGKMLGISPKHARQAFALAVQAQKSFHDECLQTGRAFLADLEKLSLIHI